MAGKLCFGSVYNNCGPAHISDSRAYCKAIDFRVSGTALERPKANNPFIAGSSEAIAWDHGWDKANASAGGTMDVSDAPCCAINPVKVVAA